MISYVASYLLRNCPFSYQTVISYIHHIWYYVYSCVQSWAWALEKSLIRPSLFPYFREIRKKRSHWPGGQSAPRPYNSSTLPMCQASTCGRVLARAQVQVLQNSGSLMVVSRFTTWSVRDCHWRNPKKKKNYRERSNIKSASVSGLTGSVPRKMADVQQKDSALTRNWTQVNWLTATYFTTKAD